MGDDMSMSLLSFQMPVKMFEGTQCVEHEPGDNCMILLSESCPVLRVTNVQ